MPSSRSTYVRQFADKPLAVGAVLPICYLLVMTVATAVAPGLLPLQALGAVAVTAVFFGGLPLAILVAGLAVIAALVAHVDLLSALILGASSGVGSATAAYVLRILKLDPLFRRKRDVFVLIAASFALSCAVALISLPLAHAQIDILFVHALASQLIGTAFLLRWIAKPAFGRTPLEWLEIFVSHALVIALFGAYFIFGIHVIDGVSLVVYSLPLLFWIALRMRPRFLTLTFMLIVATAAIGQVLTDGNLDSSFSTAILLSVFAGAFLLISAQEEERRGYKSRMQIEFATLQNVLTRVEAESKAKNDFIAVL